MYTKRLVRIFLAIGFVVSFSGGLPIQGQLPGEPLTNHDIIRMVRAKVPPGEIISKIKTSRCHFDTNPTVISEFESRGVPPSVIQAMLEAPYGSANPSASNVVSKQDAPIRSTNQREQRTEPVVSQSSQATQLTQASSSSTQAPLPKRVRWSQPLCKEIDQQGREVRTIEPAIVRCEAIYANGALIRTIESKDIYIVGAGGEYDGYFYADLHIGNTGSGRFDVLPTKALLVLWKDVSGAPQISAPLEPGKIASKIESREKWRARFRSISAALATQTSEVNTSTTGTVSVFGSGRSATGTYSENSMSTVTTPNREIQRQTIIRNEQRMAEAVERGDVFTSSALRATTLFGGQEAFGYLFFKKEKFQTGLFSMEINDTNFEFAVSPIQK